MPRHLGVVFRGTGGIVGQDYVSRVCQGASDLVEEVNPNFPATMGGLPVGTAGDFNDPSMAKGVDTAFADAKRIIDSAIAANPKKGIVVGGYSAGAVAAAKVREYVLQRYPANYVCSFSFGDPTRPSGGAYFGAKPTSGHGISTWRYGDVKDWRHCWLAQPGDMYTSVPEGDTGLIMGDFYDIVSHIQLSDLMGTLEAIFAKIPDLLTHAGLMGPLVHQSPGAGLPQISKGLDGLLNGNPQTNWLSNLLKPGQDPISLLINGFTQMFQEPQGLGAALNAAIVAIKFVADQPPTRAHITYEFGEVWPGQTYLGLAVQHVRDWSSRFPRA